jgi:POTRA domain, FtsQ-type
MITSAPDRPEVSGIRIDPRIHQRRVDVQRELYRRRLRILGSAGVVVAVVLATFLGLHSPIASVRRSDVTGARHEAAAAVLRAAGISKGEPLIDINASGAATRIEGLPWVERASVSRQWPSGVRVSVVERTAVAQVPLGSSTSGPVDLVDATGRVLAHRTSPVADLPFVTGADRFPAAGGWLAGTPGERAADDKATVSAEVSDPASALAAAIGLASTFTSLGLGQSGSGVGPDHLWIGRVEVTGDSLSAVAEPDLATFQLGADNELTAKVNATLAMLSGATIPASSTVNLTIPESPTVTSPAAAQSGG